MIGGQVVTDFAVTGTTARASPSRSPTTATRTWTRSRGSSSRSRAAASTASSPTATPSPATPTARSRGFESNFNIVNGGGEVNFPNMLGGPMAPGSSASSPTTRGRQHGVGFAVGVGFGTRPRLVPQQPEEPGRVGGLLHLRARRAGRRARRCSAYSDLDYVTSAGDAEGLDQHPGEHLPLRLRAASELPADRQGALHQRARPRARRTPSSSGNATLIRTQLDADAQVLRSCDDERETSCDVVNGLAVAVGGARARLGAGTAAGAAAAERRRRDVPVPDLLEVVQRLHQGRSAVRASTTSRSAAAAASSRSPSRRSTSAPSDAPMTDEQLAAAPGQASCTSRR